MALEPRSLELPPAMERDDTELPADDVRAEVLLAPSRRKREDVATGGLRLPGDWET